ncbi:hypothetical protein GOP47_0021131 [Adiantum capillus-veneris]|uniref:PORR domain-containing protein n=1 Tax=Adiantum capillus-veneris TaxID=13818 RepID=A0A9D4UAJ8_ADICA|nr:hypothetical protein GOP47_0021131 [Adiantum capillus-veneris]
MARRVLHKLKFSAELPLPTSSQVANFFLISHPNGACIRLQRTSSASTCDKEASITQALGSRSRSPCSIALSSVNFFGSSVYHRHLHLHEQSSPSYFCYAQKRFMSTPKIKLKVDRMLDAHAEIDKVLRPILKVKALILRQEGKFIRVRYLDIKQKQIGIAKKPVRARGFLKRYPNMFELFSFPKGIQVYCRLTQAMIDLLEEEKQIYRETEEKIVLTLRKLLMMSKDRRIKSGKLDFARKAFGLPADFATRVVPAYPQYFRVVGSGPSPFIELAAWDEEIAISELEKKAKENALKAGKGEIQTRGQPLEFKIALSPGMFLKKKTLDLLEKWQKLPYVSPYQDHSWVPKGTLLAQKRVAAVLHEFLSLTIEKRALMLLLGRFREEFDLPQSVGKLVNGLPGIFYLSLKGNIKTVFLREGYAYSEHIENHVQLGKKEAHIIEDHPLLQWRMKIAKMAWEGPRMYATQMVRANAGRKKVATSPDKLSDSDEEGEDAASGALDFDFEDSECDELDAGNECFEEEEEEEEEEGTQIRRKQGKARKEVW